MPQNAILLPKIVNIIDFIQNKISYDFYVLEAYNCKKEMRNIRKHVFIGVKRHFLTFFAIYSKRDFRATAFFQSLITPSITRLSTKSFRERLLWEALHTEGGIWRCFTQWGGVLERQSHRCARPFISQRNLHLLKLKETICGYICRGQ